VFLAACDSKFAGKIFLKKGVRHVICIEESREVLDKAVITFTDCFYRRLFDGMTICDAFKIAQKLTSNIHQEREATIFKLLVNHEKLGKCMPIDFSHKEEKKVFKNISDKILVKDIPAKIDLLFREKEMSKLIEKIMSGHKLVLIFGL
jgi:hypothetical protein